MVAQAEFRGETAPAWAEDAKSVGFVDQEQGSIFLFGTDDSSQRGAVAIHAEDRFRDHENPTFCSDFATGPGQPFFELVQIIVRKYADLCSAESGAIDQGRMAEFVEYHDIARLEQGRKSAHRRRVPTGKT